MTRIRNVSFLVFAAIVFCVYGARPSAAVPLAHCDWAHPPMWSGYTNAPSTGECDEAWDNCALVCDVFNIGPIDEDHTSCAGEEAEGACICDCWCCDGVPNP